MSTVVISCWCWCLMKKRPGGSKNIERRVLLWWTWWPILVMLVAVHTATVDVTIDLTFDAAAVKIDYFA